MNNFEREFYESIENDLDYAIKKFDYYTREKWRNKRRYRSISKMYLKLLYSIEEIEDNAKRLDLGLRLKMIIEKNELKEI